jgi:hypothetical protein
MRIGSEGETESLGEVKDCVMTVSEEGPITEEELDYAYRQGIANGIKFSISSVEVVQKGLTGDGHQAFAKSLDGITKFLKERLADYDTEEDSSE